MKKTLLASAAILVSLSGIASATALVSSNAPAFEAQAPQLLLADKDGGSGSGDDHSGGDDHGGGGNSGKGSANSGSSHDDSDDDDKDDDNGADDNDSTDVSGCDSAQDVAENSGCSAQ